jgi:hypothetical protein
MSATIGAGNSDGFIQVLEGVFDADSFVVAMRGSMETDAKKFAGFAKDATEGAAGIYNDEAAHANFQENLLE